MTVIRRKNHLSVYFRLLTSFILIISFASANLSAFAQESASLYAVEGNNPPVANAGVDQTITLADSAFLDGRISDDGPPTSWATLSTTWSQLSGPGAVAFGNADEVITTASFSTTGTYVLRLTVNDGELSSSDDLTITVIPEHPHTIRVPQDYATIQAGIDAAQEGDLVLVSPGTYVENLDIPGTITLASTFYTTGDESLIDQTVVSSPDILIQTMTVSSSAGPETQIVGFRITGGKDGIKIRGTAKVQNNHLVGLDTDAVDFSTDAAGLVQNNVMEGNGDDGVDIDDANVLITGNLMQANGEGVEMRATNHLASRLTIIIRNNTILGSEKTGLQLIDDDIIAETAGLLVIDRNLIANNADSGLSLMDNGVTSDDFRAASLLERIHLFNNTFVGNFYGAHGGDNLIALNNIFADTTEIAVKNIDGSSTLAYNLFWNNGTDNLGSNLDLTTTLFADPSLDGNYHLQSGSPAIDAGTAHYEYPPGEIVLDLPSSAYTGAAPDLGAFESNFKDNPPMANDDSAVTSQDTPVTIDVAANDTDPDDNLDPTTASLTAPPVNGTVANNGDGSFTYTPSSGYTGTDSFGYEICDTDGHCDQATVTLTVTPPNDPPTAIDDSANTNEDTAIAIDAGANDSDPDGNLDPASYAVVSPPTNGTAANDGNGAFTYTPDPNFNGNDSFTYEVCDTYGLCDSAIVSISIAPIDDPPQVNGENVSTSENEAVLIDVAANDSDPDGNLDIFSTNTDCAGCLVPANGSLTNNGDGTFIYTPSPDFTGSDSFVYEICDTGNLCDTAVVNITVNPAVPVSFEVRVSSSTDDAEEDDTGGMDLNSSDLELIQESSAQTVGIRFNGIDIPQGSTITGAYIQFQVDESTSVETHLTIQGEDVDHAATFSSNNFDITSRSRTTAEVSWTPNPWPTTGEAGPDQQTPDLATVIQEIVARPGWASGNSLAIIISGTGERTAESYDGDQVGAPLLHVEYLAGSPNSPPTAVDDTYTTDEDTALTVTAPGVLSNDGDADGDPLTVVWESGPANGTLTLNADGSFTYTPNTNFNGGDSFTYHANDGTADSNIATASIAVNPVNDAPAAVDDSATTSEDSPVTISVLANDNDPDGDGLAVDSATQGSNGTVVINADNTITYTPNAGFNGSDAFTYTANDGTATSNSATVSITVNPVNDAPAADDQSVTTDEETPTTITLTGSDPDDDPLTFEVTSGPSSGSLSGSAPDLTYTPNPDFYGMDSFTFVANDGTIDSNTATVTITVNPVNDAPVAVDDAYITSEDTALNVTAPGVLGNDSDADGDGLTAVLNSDPTNGTLTLNGDGSFSYVPNAGFNGVDSFTYHASDGTADSNIATVTLTVTRVNNLPTAMDDAYATDEDNDLNVAEPGVLGNDTDADGDTLSAVLDTGPANGTLTLLTNGSFTYSPNADFSGMDVFSYHANDGIGDSNSATVSITVNPVNDPPVANSQSVTTDEDTGVSISLNGSDLDGDTLSFSVVTGPSNGTLSGTPPNMTYTPNPNFNGTDSFTYKANDGTIDSATATVTITVNPVNDAPAADDQSLTTDEDTPTAITLTGSDPDDDPLTFEVTSGPSSGTLSGNAPNLTYTPDADYYGPDSFTFVANDGTTDSNTATVTITVNAINDAPVASDDSYSTNEDTPLNADAPGVLANDGDVDSDPLTAVLDTSPSNGTLTLNSDGSFAYTPPTGFTGTASFTYRANDGATDSNLATVTITVNPTTTITDATATGETSVAGTLSGDYTSTFDDDGNAEAITERESGGKPSTRYSYLEHKWTIDVSPGNVITLYANAWRSASTDGDTFTFAYSTDDVTYIDMFSVESTSDSPTLIYEYVLPAATQGTVTVRVTDSDHFSGHLNLDTVYVDHLYIRSESQLGSPPAGPTGLSATALSAGQIDLTWTDNASDEDGFHIQRSEDQSNWLLIDVVGTDVTAYSDPNVFPGTTYYYRVRAYNASGSSDFSDTANATTPAGINLTGNGYKVKGVQTVDLSWSGSSATSFDLYRGGNLLVSGVSGNSYTDNIGLKGSGSYQYQVCDSGSTVNCSNEIEIVF